jgi:ribose 5-phosphate isomerase B
MGSRVIGPVLAVEIVEAFLNTSFEGGRHLRRLDKITTIEG